MKTKLFIVGVLLSSSVALAGRGGSTQLIEQAIASGSDDSIVSVLEQSEILACLSCIEPVTKLVDYPSQKVRDAAGWWLGRRGVRTEIISQMTARLSAQDPVAAMNAADVLGGMRESSALPALAAYLAHPLDENSGMAAARAIGNLGNPSALAALKVGIASSLAGVKVASLQALRMLRAPIGARVITDSSAIVPLLSDANVTVRREAALTCGFLRDANATVALSQLVSSDQSPLVRKAAAWAIGEIGDGRGTNALLAAQNDVDPLVRSVATAALGRLK